MYVSEEDRILKRKVDNKEVNESFQAALLCDPSLMIEEHKYIIKKWLFGREINKTTYSIYHETPAFDGSPCQARFQSSGSGEKHVVIAYLHGIINGSVHREMNVVSNRR